MSDKTSELQVEDVPVEVVDETPLEQQIPQDDELLAAGGDADDMPACDEAEQVAVGQDGPAAIEEPCGDLNIADDSTLSIDSGVVEKIVAMTCREVRGVLQLKGSLINSLPGLRASDATKGVSVEMSGDDACTVNVAVILEFGSSAPRVFQELHDNVVAAVEGMTGLKVNAVNVRVTNVLTRAEAQGGKHKDKADA